MTMTTESAVLEKQNADLIKRVEALEGKASNSASGSQPNVMQPPGLATPVTPALVDVPLPLRTASMEISRGMQMQ